MLNILHGERMLWPPDRNVTLKAHSAEAPLSMGTPVQSAAFPWPVLLLVGVLLFLLSLGRINVCAFFAVGGVLP